MDAFLAITTNIKRLLRQIRNPPGSNLNLSIGVKLLSVGLRKDRMFDVQYERVVTECRVKRNMQVTHIYPVMHGLLVVQPAFFLKGFSEILILPAAAFARHSP